MTTLTVIAFLIAVGIFGSKYAGKCKKCDSRRNWKKCVSSVNKGDVNTIYHFYSSHCSNCGHVEGLGCEMETFQNHRSSLGAAHDDYLDKRSWEIKWDLAAGRPVNWGA